MSKVNEKIFEVQITEHGSDRAKPAIWYAGKAGETFTVIRSKKYYPFYEVIIGEYKDKIIDSKDCVIFQP